MTLTTLTSAFVFVVFSMFANSKGSEWEYPETSGNGWTDVCESGTNQSPINIDTLLVTKGNNLRRFWFKGYSKRGLTLVNNGHTVQLSRNSDVDALIKGGGLGASRFQFLQAHFHWGGVDDKGSEHTIDGNSAPMEMHFVHWNTDLGASAGDAIATNAPNALAVLGVNFKIGKRNRKINRFFRATKRVRQEGQKTIIPNIKLTQFLPDNIHEFYRYSGSLTTPTCNEVVVWTVFKEPVEISAYQMSRIRSIMHDNHGEEQSLLDNYREPQNLHGRSVEET